MPYGVLDVRRIESLEARRMVLRSGFTPTDALHVLERFDRWNVEAAQLGAELLASQFRLPARRFCEQVVERVSNRLTAELVGKVLSDEGQPTDWAQEPVGSAFLSRAAGGVDGSDLDCRLTLRRPVVAVGAPVEVYLPPVARRLNTELIVPPHADVANAIGSVAGGVVQEARILIRPNEGKLPFRLHLPDGVKDFAGVEEAAAYAQEAAPAWLERQARDAGADQVEVRLNRRDRTAPVANG